MYNVEEYLDECIQSVINQTLSFEQNVQLILVDDGSIDQTLSIAEKYQTIYNKNIIILSKENSGVSDSRNKGLSLATGKYINFLDSDDYLSLDTLEKVDLFITDKPSNVKVVAIPIYFFGARTGGHILNYKFKSNRVIDLSEEYENIQLSAASSFIDRDVLVDKVFRTDLIYGEDIFLLNDIFIDYPYLGVVSDCCYMYRKRFSLSSAVDSQINNTYFYVDYLKLLYKALINMHMNRLGFLNKNTQYTIVYSIQWHFFENWNLNQITQSLDRASYISDLRDIFKYIDYDVLFNTKNLYYVKKMYLYTFMNNNIDKPSIIFKDDSYYVKDKSDLYLLNKLSITVNQFKYKDGILHIGILYDDFLGFKFAIKFDNEYFFCIDDYEYKKRIVLDSEVLTTRFAVFKISLNNKEISDLSFVMLDGNSKTLVKNINFGQYSTLVNKNNYSCFSEGKLFTVKKNKRRTSISVINATNLKYLYSIRKKLLKHLKAFRFNVVLLNIRTIFSSSNKRIWLISDRIDYARDNGESLFKYLCENKKLYPDIIPYFIIKKDSDDYKRLSKIGRVINFEGNKHKRLFLIADKIISSHAEQHITNAFGNEKKHYRQWYNFDYVFLQHGVTTDDISNWINKVNKNISLFIAAAIPEYESLKNCLYNDNELKLVGFCRFDNLVDDSKTSNIITIFPTWRKNLLSSFDNKTGKWTGDDELFTNSDFFKFYQKLLLDDDFNECLNSSETLVDFVLHPNFACYSHLFTGTCNVRIHNGLIDYSKVISKSKCLVTDYSSLCFDFSYLNKPVIYAQFDNGEIFNSNYGKGYYDYESMGFGKVCSDYDTLKEELISTISSNCEMSQLYIDKKNSFFKFNDKNNCVRTVEAILGKDLKKNDM